MSVPTSSAQWSSRLGFILAAAGSAIGLGAIWKFPYWAGANGGAAFILPYILFTFTAEAQRPQAQDASDEIIKAGNAAIAALNAINAPAGQVEVQTADFSTWPVRTRAKEGETSEIAAWGARQTLRVTVRDLKLASAVMSAAGKSMNYDGVTFSVSRAVREAAQDELLAEAVKRATERAVTAAQALGLEEKNVRIEGIQVSGAAGPSPRYYAQPMMMRAAAANDSAEAVVSAGSADTALTVSLTVRITP